MSWQPANLRDESGFTLLELLISLSLLGLIMTYLFTSLSFGKRAWETTDDVDRKASIEAVRSYLSRRLSQVMAVNEFDAETRQANFAFEGRTDGIRFVATSQGRTEIAGLYEYEISLQHGVSASRAERIVILTQEPFPGRRRLNALDANDESRALLVNVSELRFAYFGSRKKGDTPTWADTWADVDSLPRLVRVSVEFLPEVNVRWIDLVVPLKLSRQR